MTSDAEDLKRATGWNAIGRGDLLLCVISGLTMMLIVTHFADLGRGRAAGLCVLVNVLVMKLRWEFRGKLGFWCAISLVVLGQATAIARVPFGDQSIPPYTLLPIALVVYLVDECIVFVFTRGFGTSPK
jgi:hypothetical protein